MAEISRRAVIRASLGLICAPAVVRASSLMAVVPVPRRIDWGDFWTRDPPDVMPVGAAQWAEFQRVVARQTLRLNAESMKRLAEVESFLAGVAL